MANTATAIEFAAKYLLDIFFSLGACRSEQPRLCIWARQWAWRPFPASHPKIQPFKLSIEASDAGTIHVATSAAFITCQHRTSPRHAAQLYRFITL